MENLRKTSWKDIKAEVLDVEGAPECMRISGFMHGITHPRLIKRLYERIPRSMDEMYRMTTSFLQGEVAALRKSGQTRLPNASLPVDSNVPSPLREEEGTEGPMIIEVEMGGTLCGHKVYVTQPPSEVLYEHLHKTPQRDKGSDGSPATNSPIGFSVEIPLATSQIALYLIDGQSTKHRGTPLEYPEGYFRRRQRKEDSTERNRANPRRSVKIMDANNEEYPLSSVGSPNPVWTKKHERNLANECGLQRT
ncbi:hypothetical protein Tco_0951683 [Tanacetum coccineum]|uniref:Reverse transcriptase domain-containing protein n=1 Tax=Tanacetum coccineum TaxID=301880 RepID=A0ABQ5DVK6_9ASTR